MALAPGTHLGPYEILALIGCRLAVAVDNDIYINDFSLAKMTRLTIMAELVDENIYDKSMEEEVSPETL